MSVFSLVTLLAISVLASAPAGALTIDELRDYLDQSYDENIALHRAYVDSARHVHALLHWFRQRPDHHLLDPQLHMATQNRNNLESRLKKQMISPQKLTQAEFIQIFNLTSENCIAAISGDQVIIDQKRPDGSHHLAELPLESAEIKHTVRADIGPHDVTKYADPSEFTIIGMSKDPRVQPGTESINFNFKINKRLSSNQYQLTNGGVAVLGFSKTTALFWKTEEAVILSCQHKSEIQF